MNTHLPPDGGATIPTAAQSSSGSKRRAAEAWALEETRAFISLRREIDTLFNTSKSNKHLWDNISLRMREMGFDRSPTMCSDKWKNLLKEFKKAYKLNNNNQNGSGKINFYKEIEELLNLRSKIGLNYKDDSFMQFANQDTDDIGLTFGPVEANGRSTLNLERRLDHDEHPLAISADDAIGESGASPWTWQETPASGEQTNTYEGRVITVKLGDYTKRIGIDGNSDAIKETIKSTFRIRTKRAFWLEDEDNVARTIDRDMPIGNYTLHLDEGLTVKICIFEKPDTLPVQTEDKTFYNEDDFRHEFLWRRGWTCLREYGGYRNVDTIGELCAGAIYRGMKYYAGAIYIYH